MLKKLKTYYYLTKPGIIRGNVMTLIAGFLFASTAWIDWRLLGWAMLGTGLVIASGCVLNNYIDKDIDALMSRTKKRALVRGTVSNAAALTYATLLGAAGFAVLTLFTNRLTTLVGAAGFFAYVVLYGYYKRASIHGTLVGTISGSMSLLAGYTAVTNRLDGPALLLFISMSIWQMPHFYAIGVYRRDDYKAAGIPILPVVKGIRAGKIYIFFYISAYLFSVMLFKSFGYVGWTFTAVMAGIILFWLYIASQGFTAKDNVRWAKKIFGTSLLVLLAYSLLLSLERWLP